MTIQAFFGVPDERTAISTSSAPAYPVIAGGILADDLIVAYGFSGGANATGFSTPTTGTLWSANDQHSSTGSTLAPAIATFTRWAVGGETGTVTMPHGNIVTTTGIIILRGVNKTTKFDVASLIDDKTTVNSQIQVIPSTGQPTVVTNGAFALYLMTANSVTTAATAPSGWTEALDRDTGKTGNRSFTIGSKSALTPGVMATATGAWGGSTRDVGITMIFRPATATPTATRKIKVAGVWVGLKTRLWNGSAWGA